jgi:hypothetical protein
LYNIPGVSEDGKQPIPAQDSQMKEFDGVDDAKMFAAERKNNFGLVFLCKKTTMGKKWS